MEKDYRIHRDMNSKSLDSEREPLHHGTLGQVVFLGHFKLCARFPARVPSYYNKKVHIDLLVKIESNCEASFMI